MEDVMKFRKYLLAAAVIAAMSMASGCRNNRMENSTTNHTTDGTTNHTTDGTTNGSTDSTTSNTTDGTTDSVRNETRVDGTTADGTRGNAADGTTDIYHETTRATEGLLEDIVDDVEDHTVRDNVTSTDQTNR